MGIRVNSAGFPAGMKYTRAVSPYVRLLVSLYFRLGVQDSELKVWSVWGQGSACGVQGLGLKGDGSWLRVQGAGVEGSGAGLTDWLCRFSGWGCCHRRRPSMATSFSHP